MKKAIKLYEDFHKFEPRDIGEFSSSFYIPEEAIYVGEAKDVMYRSDKLNPSTLENEGMINYIHDHKKGVKVYRVDKDADGPTRSVPKRVWGVTELVRLGECLGFTYRDHSGEEVEAVTRKPRPDLYATPDGRALLVIEGKRKVVALIWGGNLNVEPRGIVN